MARLPSSPAARHLFPRQARLTSGRQFQETIRGGFKSRDRYFRVHARPNGREYGRLGLAVSRRVDKHAVERNRLKRLIRDSFRLKQTELAINQGLDIVVVALTGAASAERQKLSRSLTEHWRNLIQSSAQHKKEKLQD